MVAERCKGEGARGEVARLGSEICNLKFEIDRRKFVGATWRASNATPKECNARPV